MKSSKLIMFLAVGLLTAWTSMVVYLCREAIENDEENVREQALISARMAYEKDIVYRRWSAMVGGVYAESSEWLPPNPYLHVPERDIVTPSGKRLTLVNPAYMTRMVHEIMAKSKGLRGHFTSLAPMRPENAPDQWEAKSLESFQQGAREAHEFIPLEGKPFLRFMSPLLVEQECLKCHANQGYNVGDVRGGISVSIPMEQYESALAALGKHTIKRYVIIYFTGFFLIVLNTYMMVRHDRFRLKAQVELMTANAKLQESDDRLRTVMNTMPDIVCFKDGQGRWLEANAFDLDLFQLADADYRGKTDAELAKFSPLYREAFLACEASDEAAWTASGPHREEETLLGPDGSLHVFDIIKVPTFHSDGSRKGLVVVGRDITERKQVEQERQLAYDRTQVLLQLGQMGGATVKEITDFTVEKAVSLTLSEIGYLAFLNEDESVLTMHSWSQAAMAACALQDKNLRYPVAEAGMLGEAVRQRHVVITNDYAEANPTKRGLPAGHVPILRYASVPIFRGDKIVVVVGVGNKEAEYAETDMQQLALLVQGMYRLLESKRAQEELQRGEALMRAMLVNLPLDFWARDIFGRVIIQSDISRSNWGDLDRCAEESVVPEETLAHWRANNARVQRGERVDREAEYTLSSGEVAFFHEIIAPIVDQEGALGFMGVNVDLTERRCMEWALRDAKETAESANKSKSEFLANMSHEIRTPLNGMLNMLQLLRSTDLDAEQKEYLSGAIKSSRRLNRLLTDLLDLSRIEAGKMTLHEADFELTELEESILEVFGGMARSKGLDLRFIKDERLPSRLVGDEARLGQILFNLVGNAIKFTDKGFVQVEVTSLPSVPGADHRLLFSVSDTGVGISDELLRDIFSPFVQGGGPSIGKYPGAGLGLSIVRRLVRLMGGGIAIDNREQGGTTVYFSLTFKRSGKTDEAIQSSQPTEVFPSKAHFKILLVDDEKVNLLTTKRLLEKAGCQVTTAQDGEEALRLLSEQCFDVVLMDILMPVMDGMEATKTIRRLERQSGAGRTPIIALTAYAMAGDRERFLATGMDGYIAKPIEMNELLPAIDEAIKSGKKVT